MRSNRAPRYPIWRLLAANIYDLRLLIWETRFALIGFAVLALIGTGYFVYGYDDYERSQIAPFTFASALYETLRLLVFQSGLPLPENDLWGGILFFVLPLLGLALVFQSVLNFGRLLLDKGSRQEAWQVALASTYKNHIVVVGLGRIGYRVVTQLQETGYEVVVIERDWESEFVRAALERRVPVVLGDARLRNILEQAQAQRARGLITTTSDDVLNIEIALVAQQEQSSLNIVLRIFDDQLDSSLERGFGRNSAFSTSALAAPTLAAAAVSRHLSHVLVDGSGQLVGLAEITVEPEGPLVDTLGAVENRYGVLALFHRRNDRELRSATIMAGDRLVLLGTLEALEQTRLANQHGIRQQVGSAHALLRPTTQYNTVIVCGLGKIGYRVLRQLYRHVPRPNIVVVSTATTSPDFLEAANAMGVRFIQGDARNPAVLREAGLDHAYSVVVVTSDTLVNIQIGLAARRIRSDTYLVLRVFSDVLADRLALLFGIYTVYSASELAAPTLAASALASDISHAVRIGDQFFAQITVALEAHSWLQGYTPHALRELRVFVLSTYRSLVWVSLVGDEPLQVGDEVTLLAPVVLLQRLRSKVT